MHPVLKSAPEPPVPVQLALPMLPVRPVLSVPPEALPRA